MKEESVFEQIIRNDKDLTEETRNFILYEYKFDGKTSLEWEAEALSYGQPGQVPEEDMPAHVHAVQMMAHAAQHAKMLAENPEMKKKFEDFNNKYPGQVRNKEG